MAAQLLAAPVQVWERIERGSINRRTADPALVQEVDQAVEQIFTVLYTPLDGRPFRMPRDAWTHSPLMQLLASVT